MSHRNFKLYLCLANYYCVFLSLFQLPRNCYDERQILMYKSIIFANNFTWKKSIWPFTYTERLLLLVILVQTYRVYMRSAMNDHIATHAMLHLNALAKIAQTAQNKRAPDNGAIVAMTTLTSRKRLLQCLALVLGVSFAWNDWQFLQISHKLQLRSRIWLFIRKGNEQTFPTIYCPYGNIVNFLRTRRIHFC